MSTFVLVHGAWHGGWCWNRLAPLLREAGHEVHAPTLTGLGDRAHLLDRTVNLSTHVEDVVRILDFYDLRDVTLVGHSYGGMVISGVAEQAGARLARLVYLDAVVPRDGEALIPLEDDPQALITDAGRSLRAIAREHGAGWLIPVPRGGRTGALFGVTDTGLLNWMEERLTPHPLATFQQPIALKSVAAAALPRVYILAAGEGARFVPYAERAHSEGWDCFEVETGHDVMLTEPGRLARILLGLA